MPRKPSEPKLTVSFYRMLDFEGCIKELKKKGYARLDLLSDYMDFEIWTQAVPGHDPKWLRILAQAVANEGDLEDLKAATPSYTAFIKTRSNTYVFCGGNGSYVVSKFADEQFGLDIAVRLLHHDKLRHMRWKHLAGPVLQEDVVYRGRFNYEFTAGAWEKLTKELIGEIDKADISEALGFEIESKRDVRIQARDACFSIRKRMSLEQLRQLAAAFDRLLKKKPLFTLFRGFEEVKTSDLRHKLFQKLVSELKEQYKRFIQDPDEFTETNIGISFSDPKKLLLCEEFGLDTGNPEYKLEEFDFWSLLSLLKARGRTDFKESYLSSYTVRGYDDDGHLVFESRLKTLLNAEIADDDEKLYALVDAKWYSISDSFKDRVDGELLELMQDSRSALRTFSLPCWQHARGKLRTEPDYITDVCSEDDGLAKLHDDHVIIEGWDKNEVCDIFDHRIQPNALIFVKRGFGAKIRELIGQVSISAEFLASFDEFKAKSVAKVASSAGVEIEADDFVAMPFILAVVDHSTRRYDLPMTKKLTTAVKLDLVKLRDLVIGALNYPGLYIYEVPRCETATL